jgi:hypothetical protein
MLEGDIVGLLTHKNQLNDYAYIGIITKEELDHTLKYFPHRDKIEVEHLETELDPDNTIATVFKYGQIVKKSPYKHQGISKSPGFARTPLFGLYPSDSEPAIQSEDDPKWNKTRHYLEVSLNKTSGVNYAHFDLHEEKWMKEFYRDVLFAYIPHLAEARLYATQTAIMGARIPGSTSMDLKNCAGLPYKLTHGVVGKSPFITVDDRGTYNISQSTYHDVNRYEKSYASGVVPLNTKLEFRKKELVGPNKIENPKTRTVGMGNYIHQIIFMKIFKDLHTHVKTVWANGHCSPIALGVDPESHWDQVAEHLQYHDYMLDLDVKAWEEKINQRLLFMVDEVELGILRSAYKSRGEVYPPDTDKIAYGLTAD